MTENDTTPAPDAEDKSIAEATDDELVAARSADVHEDESDEHVKVFVVPPDSKPGADYDHDPNIAATRQYMMSQGLRPVGDVIYKGAKAHLGNKAMGWDLTYSVPAVPAERFDFEQVGVLDQQEGTDPQQEEAKRDAAKGNDEAPPTMADTRETIDAYGAARGIDTKGAANKGEALALLTKQTA